MSTQASSNDVATRESAAAARPAPPRWPLADLWSGWPFSELAWPFRGDGPAGAPIKVEELLDGDQVVVRAELPGVDPEKDIDVTLADDVLTIAAQRHESSSQKSERGYRSEFRYGSFERSVRLPKGTPSEVVSATYRDGVLEVRMPRPSQDGRAHKVQVERG
jgi:HSP20 family protein